jgi:hypothetical protein
MNHSLFSAGLNLLPVISFALMCSACGGLPPCTSGDLFTTPLVPLSAVSYVAPIGVMAPVGGSPLPKAHTGYMLNSANVAVTSPGKIVINNIREVTYTTSATRSGYTDYALFFNVCAEVGGHFGHLSSLAAEIKSQMTGATCSEYTTVDETVRMCSVQVNILLLPEQPWVRQEPFLTLPLST